MEFDNIDGGFSIAIAVPSATPVNSATPDSSNAVAFVNGYFAPAGFSIAKYEARRSPSDVPSPGPTRTRVVSHTEQHSVSRDTASVLGVCRAQSNDPEQVVVDDGGGEGSIRSVAPLCVDVFNPSRHAGSGD